MSFFDNFGSIADSVGGFVEDVTQTATGVLTNVAKLQAAANAVNKPLAQYKGPAVPLVPNIASASSAKTKGASSAVVWIAIGGLAFYLLARKG